MKDTTRMFSLPVKRLLDGEITLAELPPELQAEGEEALRLIGAVDRAPVTLSPALDEKVMVTVRRHAKSATRRAWQWIATPREVELRLRVRPWALVGGGLAAAACLALLLTRSPTAVPSGSTAARRGSEAGISEPAVFVRFVLYAPQATRVTVAGTFNQWDRNAAPLVPAGTDGMWMTTLALPIGQYQYAFVVDGQRWVADPVAPTVDDGFGLRNSILSVTSRGART